MKRIFNPGAFRCRYIATLIVVLCFSLSAFAQTTDTTKLIENNSYGQDHRRWKVDYSLTLPWVPPTTSPRQVAINSQKLVFTDAAGTLRTVIVASDTAAMQANDRAAISANLAKHVADSLTLRSLINTNSTALTALSTSTTGLERAATFAAISTTRTDLRIVFVTADETSRNTDGSQTMKDDGITPVNGYFLYLGSLNLGRLLIY